MEQVLPKSINYLDVLPKAVPSEKKRKYFYASNGTRYLMGATVIIEIADPRSFLDANNSWLEFQVSNTTGATIGLDLGGANNFIQNFRCIQAGNELFRINNYSKLVNAVIAPVQDVSDVRGDKSLIGLGRFQNANGVGFQNGELAALATAGADMTGAHNANTQIGAGANFNVSTPLIGGFFSQAGQPKLVPLPLLNQPIQLMFDLSTVEDIGVFSGLPATYEITRARFVAELVEVPRDVLGYIKEVQLMHGGSLSMQCSSYEHSSAGIAAAATGQQVIPIPSRKRSIKSIFFVGASQTYTGAGVGAAWNTYNLSFGGTMDLVDYQVRAGSIVVPQPGVTCQGTTNGVEPKATYNNRGEMLQELTKSFGKLNATVGSGLLNRLSYASTNSDNAITDAFAAPSQQSPQTDDPYIVCPFGLDLEAYRNEAINSGFDTQTLSLEMNLQLNLATPAVAVEPIIVDCWTLYDMQLYFNADGSMTFED